MANTYTSGNCTWWVANQLSWVPGGWGNAAEWWGHAQQQGFQTSSNPQQGSIAVWGPGIDPPQGYGHVAVVTATRPDGSFTVSEMNWKGLGVVDNRNVSDRSNLLGFILSPGSSPSSSGSSGDFGVGALTSAIQQGGSAIIQAGTVGAGGLILVVGLILAVLIIAKPPLPGPAGVALKALR